MIRKYGFAGRSKYTTKDRELSSLYNSPADPAQLCELRVLSFLDKDLVDNVTVNVNSSCMGFQILHELHSRPTLVSFSWLPNCHFNVCITVCPSVCL